MVCLLITLLCLAKVISNYSVSAFILKIGKNLHNKMIHSLSRTPVSFFDANPQGRILNRFSKDIAVLDVQFTYQFMVFLNVLG